MPLPKTKDVGKVIDFLTREKPNMSRKQKIAIALSQTKKGYSKEAVKHAQKMA